MASSLTHTLTDSESTLISKLQSSTSPTIFSLFSHHLSNLTNNPNPQTRTLTLTRSLTKQFLPFLNCSLSILPKRLADLARSQSQETERLVRDLLDTYRVCLECVESLSSALACKGFGLYIQRVRFVHCLESLGLYKEGEREGFRVLENLRGLELGEKEEEEEKNKKRKKKREKKLTGILPGLVENVDAEMARVVVDLVVIIVKCVALGRSKDGGVYTTVIALVEEVTPWFRVLDANAYEKLHRVLVTCLGKCTLFLVGELMNFDGDMVRALCVVTLNEYAKLSMKDQIYKFAHQICFSLFLLQNDRPLVVTDMLICVLDFLARECKVVAENWGIEFVELVSYCASKCRTARTIFWNAVAKHLNDLAGDFCQVVTPLDLILNLYATGLSFTDRVVKSRVGGVSFSKDANDEPVVSCLLEDGVSLCNLVPVLGSLQSYFYDACKENCTSCGVEYKDFAGHICSQLCSHYGTYSTCTHKNRKVYLLAYLNVLKFLCQPLAELVNSQQKQIIAEHVAASVLCGILEAFHQFCNIFLYFHSTTSEMEKDGFGGNNTVLSVAVAAFILSIKTKLKLQKSVHLIKHIIASEWIQPQGLKYIYASLYNVGVLLYRNEKVKEASKALKLCCLAAWTRAILLSQMFMHKSNGFVDGISEDAILDFVNEAFTRTAFLLDVLYQFGISKVKKTIISSLENWSVAEGLFRRLPSPMPLVKQWVKIGCKLNQNVDMDNNAQTLYCLLSSSERLSKETIGKILQQELLAYEEMESMCPEFCHRMQMKIIDILLKDVYVTQDTYLLKSRILIRKGRALRARGLEGLRDCIQCLSEAISVHNDETYVRGTLTCHQLAVAYCLRALCIHEAEPNSKQVFQDIKAALHLWLSIPIPDYGLANAEGSLLCGGALLLLYNMVDLLSMKGSVEFHHDMYKMMIRIFKWKNVHLGECISILWESRRLNHALCVSPVNYAFITNLSGDSGEQFKSIDSWIHYLKDSSPSLIGFQQNFSYFFSNFPCGSYNQESSFRSDITIDAIKKSAFELVSSVPLTSCSLFFAGYLYYDLCERLIASGSLFEALSCAKEAHRLRAQLFRKKFKYSVGKQPAKDSAVGDHMQKLQCGPQDIEVYKSIACEVWSFDNISWDVEACYLSPWKVLQCYLESTLQVGTIHEIVGNGVEAEHFLLFGKDISCSQNLPIFIVAFSSVLGKLYRKKWSWDLSENELQSAKQILAHSCTASSCLKCRLVLEATVEQQLGDLSRSRFFHAAGNVSMERLSIAEGLYKSALEKLNLPEWKNSLTCPKEGECGEGNAFACSAIIQPDAMDLVSSGLGQKAKMETRKFRKTKNAPRSLLKESSSITEHNTRLTRSKHRSCQNKNVNNSTEVQIGLSKNFIGSNLCDLSDTISQRESLLDRKSGVVDLGHELTCICNKMKCWLCLSMEVKDSGLLTNFIHMKWEFARRRLSLRLLTGIGKCMEAHGKIRETHEIILQSVSVLVSRNPFDCTYARFPLDFLLDLVGKELSGDVFAIERAAILYNLCWFSLKAYCSKDTRIICCDLSFGQLPKIVSWLMLAFVLCREVPILFQKVSRLLSVVHILASSSESFSLPFNCKMLSESHWASYFHQASLGTHLNYQFFSNLAGKHKAQHLVVDQGSHLSTSTHIGAETYNVPRLAPESLKDLEQFVTNFFLQLPCTTIVCLSLIGDSCAKLLQELLLYPLNVSAWMLLSRFNFKSQPVVILLPVDSISEDATDNDGEKSSSGMFSESSEGGKRWPCPWGFTVVDDVASAFKLILEENYVSSSVTLEDTEKSRALWWMQRKKLDHRLSKLLRKMEDSWLGPWRYLLLGERSNSMRLDPIQKKLVHDLKSKCKMDFEENFLKVILKGARYALDGETCISQLLSLRKGCFIGKAGYPGKERCETLSREGDEKLSALAIQLLQEAVNELEEEVSATREPLILVLDCEVQMLPWENLPILRNQEVYRMPSIDSIFLTLERSCHHQEQVGRIVSTFPLIDPLDAFYLLNPSGDLSDTQVEFENWFRDQNLEGKAGSAPTSKELALALKSHDLFIYFGHGSGAQYIPKHEIQKLENCAATLLMGCSSGSLLLHGPYVPEGIPLSYLLAGSPIIVANLWEVTDKDIDRFGKAMLDSWLKVRSSVSVSCSQCNLLAKEFEALNIRGGKGNAKKKVSKKKVPEACDSGSLRDCCDHRPRIGSFMGKARDACKLPFLIGAAPVCYGVPTCIWRKMDL